MRKSMMAWLLVICFLFVGCGKSPDTSFDSGIHFCDADVYESFVSSGALFAYEIETVDGEIVQKIYVWDNLLRRELWQDLVTLSYEIPNKNRIITVENGTDIKIKNKEIGFRGTSELSRAVLNAILPTHFNVQDKSFLWDTRCIFVALETLEKLGVTEVIFIETRTDAENTVLLAEYASDGIVFVFDLDEVPSLQNLLDVP